MREADLIRMLHARYHKKRTPGNGPSAVVLPQVRSHAGFDARRTCDALVMQLWPSMGLHLEGFEIKCSRSDWLRELKDPDKADEFAQWCDKWYLLVSDRSIVKPDELPEGWGLMAPGKNGLRVVTNAPKRNAPDCVPKSMLASMLRQHDRVVANDTLRREVTDLLANVEREFGSIDGTWRDITDAGDRMTNYGAQEVRMFLINRLKGMLDA
jgi:hypothetical protein